MRFMLTFLTLASLAASPVSAETIHVGVNGMVCAFCMKGIEANFKKQSAINAVDVDMDAKTVTLVTKDQQTLADNTINQIVTDAGFTVTTIHHQP